MCERNLKNFLDWIALQGLEFTHRRTRSAVPDDPQPKQDTAMTFTTTTPAFTVRERAARTFGCVVAAEPVCGVQGGHHDRRPEDQGNRVEGQKPRPTAEQRTRRR